MLGLLCTIYLVGAVFTPMAGPRIDRRGDRTKVISGLSVFCTGILIAQSMASSFSGSAADDATAVGLWFRRQFWIRAESGSDRLRFGRLADRVATHFPERRSIRVVDFIAYAKKRFLHSCGSLS
jgi:hypothetical protein